VVFWGIKGMGETYCGNWDKCKSGHADKTTQVFDRRDARPYLSRITL